MRRTLAADPEARRDFAERMRCVPRMLHVLNRRRSRPLPPDDLEDVVQDTLVALWRRARDYAGRASLESWAYPFCRNQLANRVRARQRRPLHLSVEAEGDGPELAEPASATPDDGDEIAVALGRLDGSTAELIRMRHLEQLSFDELGERLGVPSNTAKTRYHRGLARLRSLLDVGGRAQETQP